MKTRWRADEVFMTIGVCRFVANETSGDHSGIGDANVLPVSILSSSGLILLPRRHAIGSRPHPWYRMKSRKGDRTMRPPGSAAVGILASRTNANGAAARYTHTSRRIFANTKPVPLSVAPPEYKACPSVGGRDAGNIPPAESPPVRPPGHRGLHLPDPPEPSATGTPDRSGNAPSDPSLDIVRAKPLQASPGTPGIPGRAPPEKPHLKLQSPQAAASVAPQHR